MTSEQIHSIFERKKARDVYDLFFLLRLAKFSRRLVERKLAIFGMKFSHDKFKKSLEERENVWEHELKPFVLEELFDFDTAKRFILERIKQ